MYYRAQQWRAVRALAVTLTIGVGSLVLSGTSAAGTAVDRDSDDVAPQSAAGSSQGELESIEAAALAGEADAQQPDGAGAALDSSCPDGYSCMWDFADFNGDRRLAFDWMAGGGWYYYEGEFFRSAKNRFGNRRFRVWSAIHDTKRCLDPGESRPDLPNPMFYFRVGLLNSRCSD